MMNAADGSDLRKTVKPRVLDFLNSLVGQIHGLGDTTGKVDVTDTNGVTLHDLKERSRIISGARDVVNKYLSDILSAQNRHIPIAKLPTESLCIVFRHALTGEKSSRYYGKLYQLIRVSRHWRTIIESNPSFWAVIAAEYRWDFRHLVLRRSGMHPLILHADDDDTLGIHLYVVQVLPEQSRWEEVYFRDINEAPLLRSIAQTAAPHLSNLHITYDHDPDEPETWTTLFGDNAPRLQSVHLGGVAISRWISAPVLTGITSLYLETNTTGQFTYSDIMTTLVNNPNLERLTLDHVGGGCRGLQRGDFLIPTIPLEFRHLQELFLTSSGDELCTMIIDSINAPCYAKFTPAYPEGPAISLHCLTRHLVPWMKRSRPTEGEFQVCDFSSYFSWDLGNGRGGHRFRGACILDDPPIAFPWLASLFTQVAFRPALTLRVGHTVDVEGQRDGRDILDYLWDLPHIGELSFNDDTTNSMEPLMRLLKEPHKDGDSNTYTWCLPNLKELAFPGTVNGNDLILPMLRSRYGSAEGADAIREPLPVPFEALWIWDLPLEARAEVEEIVGDIVRTWAGHG